MRTARWILAGLVVGLLAPPAAHAGEGAMVMGEWDDLAKQILPKYLLKNVGMGTFFQAVRKATCTIKVTMSSSGSFARSTGTIEYSLEDLNNDRRIAPDEVRADPGKGPAAGMGPMLHKICKELEIQTMMSGSDFFLSNSIKTVKTDEGYRMTLKPGPDHRSRDLLGYSSAVATISDDLRMTESRVDVKGGVTVYYRFKHRRLGDRWISAGYTQTTRSSTSTITDRRTDEYTEKDGLLVLSRISVVSSISVVGFSPAVGKPGAGTITTRQELKFINWKLTKR